MHDASHITEKDLDASLARRSKAELIALIKQWVLQKPELAALLQLPKRGPGKASAPVRAETYRRRAAAAFQEGGYEYGAGAVIAEELAPMKEVGDGLLAQMDFTGAAAVYQGLLEAIAEGYFSTRDDEGDVTTVAYECVESLAECLPKLEDAARREAALRALFALWRADMEFGGTGLSDPVPELLRTQTNAKEKQTVANWVREALHSSKKGRESFGSKKLGGFLLELEADTLDDEAFLRVCLESGRFSDAVGRLLERGRTKEAEQVASKAGDFELMQLADLFVQKQQRALAERLMQQRARSSKDTRLLEWLEKSAAARGDTDAVRELALRRFRVRPGSEGYKELRTLNGNTADWPKQREGLLAFLKKERCTAALVSIHLDEGDIDRALALVQGMGPSPLLAYGGGGGLVLEVAKAAERTRPQAALELYRHHAEALIGLGGRSAYQQACGYLRTVRALFTLMGEEPAWERYIAGLREKHRRLRALQEELRAARL